MGIHAAGGHADHMYAYRVGMAVQVGHRVGMGGEHTASARTCAKPRGICSSPWPYPGPWPLQSPDRAAVEAWP